MRTAFFEFADASAVLSAAKEVGDPEDEHHCSDEHEEVRECEDDRKVFKDIGSHKVTSQMRDTADAADERADHHFQTAIRIFPYKIHDLDRHLRVLALDRILLSRTAARANGW